MKKFLLGILLPFLAISVSAQDKTAAKQLVLKNVKEIKMGVEEVNNFFISDTYSTDGIMMVYANQEYKNVPVMNQMYVLSFRGDKLLSSAGAFIQNMEAATAGKSATASVPVNVAAKAALAAKNIVVNNVPNPVALAANKFTMGRVAGVTEDLIATLLWVQMPLSSEVKLVWQVQVVPKSTDDYLLVNMDAHTGAYLNELNLTVYEHHNKGNQIPALLKNYNLEQGTGAAAITEGLPKKTASRNNFVASPAIVNNANYTVFPVPIEAPSFGTFGNVSNPWAAAPGNATSLGWHGDGTVDYNITRGNNVWATEDRAATNTNAGLPATSSTSPDPLNFLSTPNLNSDPTGSAFQRFAITNLFYLNNVVHDVTYQHGFTETAGNFQRNNQGRGGAQFDDVIALAQSGSGTNNANFSTPADGGRGRMRMYLFDASPTINFTVNTPPAIAGAYAAVESGFSTANKICALGPLTGQLIYFNDDAAGTTHFACGAPTNNIAGKIAVINRGNGGVCANPNGVGFIVKVKNAQDAGAIAVIMINNIPGPPGIMGGSDNTITIPAFMISDVDGVLITAQIANNVTVTMSGSNCFSIDGDLDAGVVFHEFGHGVSNRFTGGPSNVTCLQQVEQGGEGWSDYIGLMLTTNWATANVNTGAGSRGIGTYLLGQPTTGVGFRNFRYSTNMTTNPLTYANMGTGTIGVQVHNIGEIWCTAIWEMTWGLIQQTNTIDPNIYNYSSTSNAGNIIAFKLVMEGMKLQPCRPGYIDARDAILAADRNLYNGSHACTIWTAFAKRGMGFGSSQGSSEIGTDQTSTTTIPPAPTVTTQPTDVSAAPGASASFTASAGTDPNLIYQWQVSTNNGGSWNNIIGQISSTLTLNNVQIAQSNNLYRARVFYACDITNTNSARLTVAGAPTLPVITTQPANASVCSGTNASFTVVATGDPLTYAWQVSTNGGTTFTDIIPAVTTATLTLSAVTVTMNNNQYRVVVTNASGSVTSTAATLTVSAASTISITAQPQSVTVCSGTNTSFSVTTTGTPISYVWQVSTNGGTSFTDVIPANTTATLTLNNVTTAMSGNQYRVIITGGCPVTTVTSNAATLTVNNSVVTITTQPASVTVCAPAAATFTAAFAGTGLSYQWQLSTDNGATYNNIMGANATTYSSGATSTIMNNYRYRIVATNTCNPAGIISNAAILTVGTQVSITTQPTSVTTCAGTNATFSATVTGVGATYQWQVSTNGGTSYTDISGANSTTLTLTAVTAAMNNNRYQLVVTGSCNNITSNSVTLTVINSVVTITTQPASVTVCAPAAATFTAAFAGTGLGYQWQLSIDNGSTYNNILGANATTYNTGATSTTMNNYRYRIVATNTCNPAGIISNAAILTVGSQVSITAQPASVTTCAGTNATFSATVTGVGATYQWQVSTNGGTSYTDISGANSTTLTLTAVIAAMNNNRYQLVVTGSCNNVTSNSVTLTVNTLVTISQQPGSTTICNGANASFSVLASSGATYQWQVSVSGGAFSNIGGATAATYTVNSATTAMSGNKYRVVISGSPCGTTTSSEATLTVNATPLVNIAEVTVGGVIGVQVTTTPAGTYTYEWYKEGVLVSSLSGAFNPSTSLENGKYTVIATSALGCKGASNAIDIFTGALNSLVIFPNPSTGVFKVKFITNNSIPVRGMVIYDSKGARVYKQNYNLTGNSVIMDVNMKNAPSGIYIIDLFDGNGKRLATGQFSISTH